MDPNDQLLTKAINAVTKYCHAQASTSAANMLVYSHRAGIARAVLASIWPEVFGEDAEKMPVTDKPKPQPKVTGDGSFVVETHSQIDGNYCLGRFGSFKEAKAEAAKQFSFRGATARWASETVYEIVPPVDSTFFAELAEPTIGLVETIQIIDKRDT